MAPWTYPFALYQDARLPTRRKIRESMGCMLRRTQAHCVWNLFNVCRDHFNHSCCRQPVHASPCPWSIALVEITPVAQLVGRNERAPIRSLLSVVHTIGYRHGCQLSPVSMLIDIRHIRDVSCSSRFAHACNQHYTPGSARVDMVAHRARAFEAIIHLYRNKGPSDRMYLPHLYTINSQNPDLHQHGSQSIPR